MDIYKNICLSLFYENPRVNSNMTTTQITGRPLVVDGQSPLSQSYLIIDNSFPLICDSNEPVTKPLDYGKVFSTKTLESKFIVPNDIEPIPVKSIQYDNGVPMLEWEEVEVTRDNKIKFLQYAIIGKFVQGCQN